jgi:hypothetical protein
VRSAGAKPAKTEGCTVPAVVDRAFLNRNYEVLHDWSLDEKLTLLRKAHQALPRTNTSNPTARTGRVDAHCQVPVYWEARDDSG